MKIEAHSAAGPAPKSPPDLLVAEPVREPVRRPLDAVCAGVAGPCERLFRAKQFELIDASKSAKLNRF
jgi:hypothetical protein